MAVPLLVASRSLVAPTPSGTPRLAKLARAGWLALATAVAVIAGVLSAPAVALADSAPVDVSTPVTVAADSLPTTQINGVVWTQLIVGNTVYVGGEFTRARPAGSARGVNEVVRNNLLAYNLTTGQLMSAFNPNLNGAVRALVASADGTRVYAGGSFTKVGSDTRYRLAAFDTGTGALVSTWKPVVNASVKALGIFGNTVYAGGTFSTAGGQARTMTASFAASNGALGTWTGEPAGGGVNALTISPDGGRVIIGGAFTSYNGNSNPGYGMAATDAATGASLPWKINSIIRNGGKDAAILSLTSSEQGVIGTGYVFGTGGTLEGAFRASWDEGALIWVEDCHGDTYSAVPVGDVVYTTSHAHFCGNIAGPPQTDPWTFHRTLTFTSEAKGIITRNRTGGSYYNFEGTPRPDLLTFYPDINSGTYTGQGQGPWNIAANEDYLLYGGEFTIVNNKGQQGLARFAARTIAPNKEGPRVTNTSFVAADFVPSVASFVPGGTRLSWMSAYDRDNENLSYEVLRDGASVATILADSTDWNRPMLSWSDAGLTPGQSYDYRIRVTDPFGNSRTGAVASVTVAEGAGLSDYAASVLGDSPRSYWPLGEQEGTTAFDWSGGADLAVRSGVTRDVSGAIAEQAASRFDGTANGLASTATAEGSSNNFSVEAWVKTTTTRGGKIVGFGDKDTGNSTGYDRHVYMDNSGKIWFGAYPSAIRTINTSDSYNDGQWHHIVASLSPAGMTLYIDGKRAAHRSDVTTGQVYQGFWRIGGDTLSSWTSQPTSGYIAADIDEVALYSGPLSRQQVLDHYVASGRTSPVPAAPADSYGAAVYGAEPDLYWRLGEAAGTTALDAGQLGNSGTYSGAVTKGADALITGTNSTAVTFNDGTVSSDTQFVNPTTYSLEAWFNTTTTQGGKIIGFGNRQTGLSTNYDRHVYLQDDGRLVFGTWTGKANLVTSAASYNDGVSHHVVAVQSPAGMQLYVDGALVGTNPQPAAQAYSGYWRIGSDPTWGSSSPALAGTLDEVAVYPTALEAAVIGQHFALGSGGSAANLPPTAAFVSSVDGLALQVDASSSSDSDGQITGYAWTFGDGATGTAVQASHTYAESGTYEVTLIVTDDAGATAAATESVTVTAVEPPVEENAPPVAAFTATATDLAVAVDGVGSSDADGTIAGYTWTWGDGATESAAVATATHGYAVAGTYEIVLTVTDDAGATASASQRVVVTDPAPAPATAFAADAFSRAMSTGFGTADLGGSWTTTGSAANYSVGDGVATLHAVPGRMLNGYLSAVLSTETDLTVTTGVQQAVTGGGVYLTAIGRRVGTDDYRARVKLLASGAVQVQLLRYATSLKSLTIPGLSYAAGDQLQLRVQVTGTAPTTLKAMAWKLGEPAPDTWQVSATDSTAALQQAGSIGVAFYVSGSATVSPMTATFDDLIAVAPQ
ncbi:LamG-like jellyroll fold domain-containing protein [Cryobacterium sp. Y50]|uniref:LamG-like jellyroll fold domain-containing protein n=1 Tax=Cryobacterium sp. Y50 TaxID=2048286 RepID=UPI001E52DF37|nr:LamG-like jellyroll fold domain-containing protein [Cryobacterium sp. Y50]